MAKAGDKRRLEANTKKLRLLRMVILAAVVSAASHCVAKADAMKHVALNMHEISCQSKHVGHLMAAGIPCGSAAATVPGVSHKVDAVRLCGFSADRAGLL